MEVVKYVFLFGLIAMDSSILTLGWRPFRIHNLNVTAYSLSDKIEINASRVDMEGISLFINVKKPLQHVFARFEIYVDSGSGLIDLKYINETIDMCRFFREKTYMPLVQVIYRTIVDQGNYPTSCPIRQKIFMGENMKMDVEKLPPTLPNKVISVAAIISSKEGAIMKPLFVYRVITKIVNI